MAKLIYVVEDDEDQLCLLRFVLNDGGFDVVTESEADQALRGVRRLRPDLVLLDIMLPSSKGVDGFELCAQIRQDPTLSDIKVVLLSAIAEGVGDLRKQVCSQIGADDFLLKPYDPGALVLRIRELVAA